MSIKIMSRRQFLRVGGMSTGALFLAACGPSTPEPVAEEPTPEPPTPEPEEPTPEPEEPTPEPEEPTPEPTVAEVEEAEQVIVGDVLDYALTSDEWTGVFGFVTFRLHEALYNGESVYYIRTDASEPDFAAEHGLVYVPLLNVATGSDITNSLYLFNGDDRLPVVGSIPGHDDYTPLFLIKQVTVHDDSLALDSAEAIEAAAADGGVSVEPKPILVNYPVVKWPDGELPVDTERDSYLGAGQLLEPVDTENMTVTFKLHECFPGSRYIVTDTSAVPMAPMMAVPASASTQELVELRGTDEIWVFGNGIPGSGVMGFQPAIFGHRAGDPTWSPFWDHFTLVWRDEGQARILRTADEVQAALDADEVELFNGTPDSHPMGFVVNCPVPVLAPNTV